MTITSDLWALIATLGLAVFQIGLQSIPVLRQVAGDLALRWLTCVNAL